MYLWVKVIHLFSLISWMAGLFYLPRLFVYHVDANFKSDMYKKLVTMEKKLAVFIMGPSLMVTWISGVYLSITTVNFSGFQKWFILKIILVFLMTVFHGYLEIIRSKFKKGLNNKTSIYFRCINEIPTIILIFILVLVIIKPFQ